jgi:hypothetical protein
MTRCVHTPLSLGRIQDEHHVQSDDDNAALPRIWTGFSKDLARTLIG